MKVEILGICLTPFPIKWAGKAAKQVYHKLRQKDTRNAKGRVTVNFLHSAWLLRGMAYNKSTKDRSNVVHCSHQSERKPPPGVPAPKGGLLYLVLTAHEPSIKPLADVVSCYICSDRQYKRKNTFHFSHLPSRIKWAGKAANPLYHTFRQKDTGDAKRRATVNFLCSAWLFGKKRI